MKLKKILALLTILLLALTACKSTEEPKPDPLKLSERAGVYRGSGAKNEFANLYAIVKVKDDGNVLAIFAYNPDGVAESDLQTSTPVLDAKSELTSFELQTIRSEAYKITFESKTTIKFTAGFEPNLTFILTKQ